MTGLAQVAILAGGGGTRLRERSGTLPKPMVALAGRPVLEHQIDRCRATGLSRIALLVHFRHEAISAHFGDGSRFGVQLHYCVEAAPRGTAGALRDALPWLERTFLVVYGDTYFDVDLQALARTHERRGADATIMVHPNDHPHDSDLVELDDAGWVRALWPCPHPPAPQRRNLVNAALCVLQRDRLAELIDPEGSSDLAKHVFPAMLTAGRKLAAHLSVEYIKDMGTPERLDRVEADIASGLPERLSTRQARSAVFLDRDGTLNHEVGHLNRVDQLQLIDGAGDAVRRLNRAGTLAVVVTNQPVLARGELSARGLAEIHARLEALLGSQGAYLDRIYHCPHHPDRGFAGEVSALKIECDCRKPAAGMIDAACRDLAIDRRLSWMVGDHGADVEAGRRAGLKTILLPIRHGEDLTPEAAPDYVMTDLAEAVEWILEGHDAAARRFAVHALPAMSARLILIGGLSRSGKSTGAQLLKEIAAGCGRRAHVISLDGWLRPLAERPEGDGVLARFDLDRAVRDIAAAVGASRHLSVRWPRHDRSTRTIGPGPTQTIAPDDLLIVEGVPALLHAGLRELADWRVQIVIAEAQRRKRFELDYRSRGRDAASIDALFAAREADETPVILAAGSHADLRLSLLEPT